MGLLRKIDRNKGHKSTLDSFWLRQIESICRLEKAGFIRIEYDEKRVFIDDRIAALFITNRSHWENFLFRLSVYASFRRAFDGVKTEGLYWNFHYYILSVGRIVSAFGLYVNGKSTLSASV